MERDRGEGGKGRGQPGGVSPWIHKGQEKRDKWRFGEHRSTSGSAAQGAGCDRLDCHGGHGHLWTIISSGPSPLEEAILLKSCLSFPPVFLVLHGLVSTNTHTHTIAHVFQIFT